MSVCVYVCVGCCVVTLFLRSGFFFSLSLSSSVGVSPSSFSSFGATTTDCMIGSVSGGCCCPRAEAFVSTVERRRIRSCGKRHTTTTTQSKPQISYHMHQHININQLGKCTPEAWSTYGQASHSALHVHGDPSISSIPVLV
jgi:hypothetical protein